MLFAKQGVFLQLFVRIVRCVRRFVSQTRIGRTCLVSMFTSLCGHVIKPQRDKPDSRLVNVTRVLSETVSLDSTSSRGSRCGSYKQT